MRNPKWHRDEIILALDLYFNLESGQMNSTNPEIIELSKLLNKLPIHEYRPDAIKFRNPNGVNLKLNNFKAFDPNYQGKGMKRGSKLDKKVFKEFYDNRKLLSNLAESIRSTVEDSELANKLYDIPEDEEPVEVKEGKVIYKLHKYYERNYAIIKRKKSQYLKRYGKLDCETCGFIFEEQYGKIGKGFIECHHRIPLHQLSVEKITKLEDLALVCSNCHRMLHRKISSLTINELQTHLKYTF